MKTTLASLAALTVAAACSHRPPADFAPDPALIQRIRAIELAGPRYACPGHSFATSYTAVLDDGSRVPFATRYDRKQPPPLHVVFLERHSPDAIALEDGGWTPERDPLTTAVTGFRLHARLRANPALGDSLTIAPSYECLRHAFTFTGETSEDGPDVVIRLGMFRSPFVNRLLVAQLDVALAPPFFVLADADLVPPSDWLIVTSEGGSGARGAKGRDGGRGANGTPGCPGTNGGAGGRGGDGLRGENGGRGGRFTIMVPTEEPFLAGLVDARSPGGEQGPGGAGGAGGAGGRGGAANGTNCAAGSDGPAGAPGREGPPGSDGSPGGPPQILTLRQQDVFGAAMPAELRDLLDYGRRRRP